MKFFAIAAVATVSANQFDHMNEDELLVNLESTLSSALSSEARGDGDAAVAKTAAIKNIQKGLRCQRYGQEMISIQLISHHAPDFVRGVELGPDLGESLGQGLRVLSEDLGAGVPNGERF